MPEIPIGSVDGLQNGHRIILAVDGIEISVFQRDGRYFAVENRCLHQGGPVGEGELMPKVDVVLGPNREIVEERWDEERMHLVCPWHGWEYELETGRCVADGSMSLRTFDVSVNEGEVYVTI